MPGGSAWLYDAASGAYLRKLTGGDTLLNDAFGCSVAIYGDVAIVGASSDDDAASASGSAYLFNATTGEQIEKLTPSDGGLFDDFGCSVALAGYRGIAGAQQPTVGAGTAYLFAVPEPASMTLLVLGGLSVVVRRKRRA